MVRKDRKPTGAPDPKELDRFVSGAQTKANEPTKNPYDPNESRTTKVKGKIKAHKTIGLQFNSYEWWELEQAVEKTKRSINSIIREGIIKELESIK
jgi:hypothetical protein